MTGRVADAKAAIDEARRADPQLSIAWLKKNKWSDSQVFLAQRERFYEGLRKAGLPEQ